jgi:hypothetical protein
MDNKPERKIERRLPLTDIQKQLMLMIVLRKDSVFQIARSQLKPEHFNAGEQAYAVIWAAVLDHWKELNELPGERALLAEIDRRIKDDPGALTDDEIEFVDGFLADAFAVKKRLLSDRVAMKYMRIFLEDRLTDRAREMFHLSPRTPKDLFALTSRLAEEAGTICAMDSSGAPEPFPKDWDKGEAPVVKITTQIPFLDRFYNGGDSPGEAYGLLAPFGSCKTTLAVQWSTLRARLLQNMWLDAHKRVPLPVLYYFFHEGTMAEFRVRALSHLAQIDRELLETGDWGKLSTGPHDLKPYERAMFASQLAQGLPVLSEMQRKVIAENILNRNWRAIDMTGNDPSTVGRGWGLVDEYAAYIRRDQAISRGRGLPICCGGIVSDFVGAAVDSFIEHHNLRRKDEMRFLIANFALHAKNKLAIPFKCPVYLNHQLNGEANAFGPGRIPHYTDSAEGKAFAMHLDFCCCIGGKNNEGLMGMACRKARRAPIQTESVIRLDGKLSTVRDTEGEYVIDPMAHAIVKAEDMHKVRDKEKTVRPRDLDRSARSQLSSFMQGK